MLRFALKESNVVELWDYLGDENSVISLVGFFFSFLFKKKKRVFFFLIP